jgi:hypothetical protein
MRLPDESHTHGGSFQIVRPFDLVPIQGASPVVVGPWVETLG